MQIGRITGLTEPHDWQETNDDTVSLTFDYQSTAAATDGLVVRDALLSYPTPDEPVIPVIVTSDPRRTGYYAPVRTEILSDQMVRIRGNLFNVRMDLQRVAGFAQPTMESVFSGAVMTNVVAAVATDCWPLWGVSKNVIDAELDNFDGSPVSPTSPATRKSADGDLYVANAEQVAQFIARFYVAPADYYTGACKFQQGSPLSTVVGRGLVQALNSSWVLTNGVVKIVPSASAGKLDISHWKPGSAAWSTAKTYKLTGNGNVTNPSSAAFTSLAVLRNSPEAVVIRLGLAPLTSVDPPGRWYLDLAIRRGSAIVRAFLTSRVPSQYGIARNSVEAATAVTFGGATTGGEIRATADDADSMRYTLFSVEKATTNDLVNGAITQNANQTTFEFGISTELRGSVSGPPDDAVTQGKEYITGGSEEMRVVAR